MGLSTSFGRALKLFGRSNSFVDFSFKKLIKLFETFFPIDSDLDKLKEGIGEKLSIFIYLLMSFIISVIFSFFYGWKLTLVILSCAPFIILSTAGRKRENEAIELVN